VTNNCSEIDSLRELRGLKNAGWVEFIHASVSMFPFAGASVQILLPYLRIHKNLKTY
jgi:hypothetical protein